MTEDKKHRRGNGYSRKKEKGGGLADLSKEVKHSRVCSYCNGEGYLEDANYEICDYCGGTGEV